MSIFCNDFAKMLQNKTFMLYFGIEIGGVDCYNLCDKVKKEYFVF